MEKLPYCLTRQDSEPGSIAPAAFYIPAPPGRRGESEKMKTTEEIRKDWSAYDQSVAKCHLANYGVIFLDSFGCPIDNEYETEKLYNNLK